MNDEEDIDEILEHEVFDTSGSSIEYHRSKDLKRVTMLIKDEDGISEMKIYLILSIELEKLEKRLGISEADESQH